MGRRGEGQDRRLPRTAGGRRRPLSGRFQRRTYGLGERRGVQAPPLALGHPLQRHVLRRRQRRRRRSEGHARRDGRDGKARHRRLGHPPVEPRPCGAPLSQSDGRPQRGAFGQRENRHHEARHRPLLSGQGKAHRHPRLRFDGQRRIQKTSDIFKFSISSLS